MKTPPLLLGCALLFWGWQTGYIYAGLAMGLILESARFIKARWEFSDDDFARIWIFSILLFCAVAISTFNSNSGPTDFDKLLKNPNFTSERVAGDASALTLITLIRTLPMIFFLFVTAQAFSVREGMALESLSFLARRRLKKARQRGMPLPPRRRFDMLYPYFAACLFSAGGHAAEGSSFYFGLAALLAWALFPSRSRRFALPVWGVAFAVAVTLGYFGQKGISQTARLIEEYNPQWFARLLRPQTDPMEARTEIGRIRATKLSGRIVIRLQAKNGAPSPVYLRQASYRSYYRQTWTAGNAKDDFVKVSEIPLYSGNWPLQSALTNPAAVNIAFYLDGSDPENQDASGLLPLPTDCERLENLPAYFVWQSSMGDVRADGPRLLIFDARFGSGSTRDASPQTDARGTNEDLFVPEIERPALEKIASKLNVSGGSDSDKLLAIGRFFANNFSYTLTQDAPRRNSSPNATPLGRFLLTSRKGDCEYFATATVLLLRQLGIPARYAVGYYVHEPFGRGYIVRMRDAHSWCLVWNKEALAWQNFDTTPAAWISAEEERASPLQFLSDLQSWLVFEVIKFFDYSKTNVRQYLLWILIPALVFMLFRIFRGSRRQQNEDDYPRAPWPGLDSEFYRLEQRLIRNGLPRQPGEPLSLWLHRATSDESMAGLKGALERVLHMHYRHRFDPRGLNPAERQRLREQVEKCLSSAPGGP